MNSIRARLVPAWLATAAIDGAFASALTVFGYHSNVGRLWRGVASTLLGPAAMDGGTSVALVGVVMHVLVALLWTTVFFVLYGASPALRRIVSRPAGTIGVAAVYGPLIWMVMSLVVIPRLTGRPPTVNTRWFIQLAGHFPFVALPIVAIVARGLGATTHPAGARRWAWSSLGGLALLLLHPTPALHAQTSAGSASAPIRGQRGRALADYEAPVQR